MLINFASCQKISFSSQVHAIHQHYTFKIEILRLRFKMNNSCSCAKEILFCSDHTDLSFLSRFLFRLIQFIGSIFSLVMLIKICTTDISFFLMNKTFLIEWLHSHYTSMELTIELESKNKYFYLTCHVQFTYIVHPTQAHIWFFL